MTKKIITAILFLWLLCGTAMAGDCPAQGPWEYLKQWEGKTIDINLESNIVLLEGVRLEMVTKHGLVVTDSRGKKIFVSYEKIMTVTEGR